MDITIICDQIDCEFNKESRVTINMVRSMIQLNSFTYSKPSLGIFKCTHPKPVIVTTFGKDISTTIRKCHSKSINHEDTT